MFLALGEHDIAGDPHTIPACFTACRDFTLFVLPAVYVAIATDHRAEATSERNKEIADIDLGRQLKPT